MSLTGKIKRKLYRLLFKRNIQTDPAKAYDLWASTYDSQTNNLLIQLDDDVFNELFNTIDARQKIIADIGCGTGRHWHEMHDKKTAQIIGFDVSAEMLSRLRQKFPSSKLFKYDGYKLNELATASCDIIVSTLVIGYIKDLSNAFTEWDRALKANGSIIITDFHPVSIQNGATRSFKHNDKTVFIKNYLHSLDKIRTLADTMEWQEIKLIERKVDEKLKPFFIENNIEEIYKNSYGTPVLYGFLFKKQ